MRKTCFSNILSLILIMPLIFFFFISEGFAKKKIVRLAYVEWSSEIASTNLVKAVLQEKLGYRCIIEEMAADEMWQAVASGKIDTMVSAWFPSQKHYYSKYKDKVQDLGPNLEGTRIGLVVPDVTVGRLTAGTGKRNKPYITINSISKLKDHVDKFDGKIIGIDPESGIMKKTREAMQAYNLENDYRLITGSEVAMTAELSNAIRHQEWIVVTGWIPHWMFARWNLKFLEDPQNIFGKQGSIHTIARKDLKNDMPEVYNFLDKFYWSPEEMGQLMIWNRENHGLYPYEKALRWIRTHPERIESWLK